MVEYGIVWNIFQEIKQTENKWQEKLRRLEAIEARGSISDIKIPKLSNISQAQTPAQSRRGSLQGATPELKRHRSVDDVSIPIGGYESSDDEDYITANSRKGSKQSAHRRGSRAPS
ncbi:unnamed protein product [Bursaphelenchus okinawaensis]|uniref:Uncharacterized protein n=1 Tax=Bursaphelenchus okinawaensis TaxID=465554 RepID=A0A811KP99_9BILA|nr:unnamed protein product [Bursaphelenchus okinawaensis]CAG9106791.1 unnamed protein product [Bursaphelenchus okinawaensis]